MSKKRKKKLTKKDKIKILEDKYKGALSEYILNWHDSANSEIIISNFWKHNTPEKVEESLLESDLI